MKQLFLTMNKQCTSNISGFKMWLSMCWKDGVYGNSVGVIVVNVDNSVIVGFDGKANKQRGITQTGIEENSIETPVSV